MLIAIAILLFYVLPYGVVIWNIRDDLKNSAPEESDVDAMAVIAAASLIPLVSFFFLYYIATVKYKIQISSPAKLWSRFVLWALSPNKKSD